MTSPPIVVIGASAGGIEALRDLAAGLPPEYPGTLCVVLHMHAETPSALPHILSRAGPLPARHPEDGEELRGGTIYVAPPDHHLLVDGHRAGVKRGPKENRFRPSVDALFRSAAYTRAPGVIGVVLSGMLDDGTSGLWTIKRRGGVAVVQDPGDAAFDPMPRHALEQVNVDHQLRAQDMGPLLARLVQGGVPGAGREDRMDEHELERLMLEVGMSALGPDSPTSVQRLGPYSPFTCPECHGAMVQFREGGVTRFRCHTGHAYTAPSLLAELSEAIEDKLYQTLRAMEEGILLLGELGRQAGDLSGPQVTALLERAREVQRRADVIQGLALGRRTLAPDEPLPR
ncbi:chemotaxis protein CheB [Deinococcus sp. YIM 134068]|uniref:chemotaxis protein CheB n=1 Tax=Deinococcus lichenicola TaxID=3118910 RepID=UPI002F949AD6